MKSHLAGLVCFTSAVVLASASPHRDLVGDSHLLTFSIRDHDRVIPRPLETLFIFLA